MPCAVILTAIPVEYKAVQAHLTDLQEKVHPDGTIYEIGKFSSDGRSWQVAIAEIGAGCANAAVETKRAIDYFKPEVLLFVGVAGGIKDVKLGDVVAATKVYGYESGKVVEGAFLPRPNVGFVSYRLEQRAKAEAREDHWLERIKAPVSQLSPQALVGALVAGEKVVASTKSKVYQLFRDSYSDALAVEMESHGVLKAVRAHPEINALIVRGISDLIDKKGEADTAGNQEIAARHASAFAFQVLAKLELEKAEKINSSKSLPKNEAAIQIWREKLAAFQREEAITADPARRFELKKLIEECQKKIQELDRSVPHNAQSYSQQMQMLKDSDLEKLAELVKRSSRADHSARKALCIEIRVDPNELDFLAQTAPRDFAQQLVFYLSQTGNTEALSRLCQAIAPILRGSFAADLAAIQAKLW